MPAKGLRRCNGWQIGRLRISLGQFYFIRRHDFDWTDALVANQLDHHAVAVVLFQQKAEEPQDWPEQSEAASWAGP